jgi:hypothetical protein
MFHYTQLYFMYIVGDNVHEIQLCVEKYKKEVTTYMKYSSMCSEISELYFMYIVTSFVCFCTKSCTSCTLSLFFYVSLHTAVLHVHCHLFFIFHYTQMCMKCSSVCSEILKEVTMYMKYNSLCSEL